MNKDALLALRDYLEGPFMDGADWGGKVVSNHWRLHETARTSDGRFVHLEGGRPALREDFLDELDGIPRAVFDEAIATAATEDPETMTIFTRYWQRSRLTRPSLLRVMTAAGLEHVDKSIAYRRRTHACRLIWDYLPPKVRGQILAEVGARTDRGAGVTGRIPQ